MSHCVTLLVFLWLSYNDSDSMISLPPPSSVHSEAAMGARHYVVAECNQHRCSCLEGEGLQELHDRPQGHQQQAVQKSHRHIAGKAS